jgi:hypothetical protein
MRNEYQPKLNLLKDQKGNIVGKDGKIIHRLADYFKMLNNELEDENEKGVYTYMHHSHRQNHQSMRR